jgi:hypothetical protein
LRGIWGVFAAHRRLWQPPKHQRFVSLFCPNFKIFNHNLRFVVVRIKKAGYKNGRSCDSAILPDFNQEFFLLDQFARLSWLGNGVCVAFCPTVSMAW